MDICKVTEMVVELFSGRPDVVAERWRIASAKSENKFGYRPICARRNLAGQCPKTEDRTARCSSCSVKSYGGVTTELVGRHVKGEIVLGSYPLHPDDTWRWIAADFDDHDGKRNPLGDIRQVAAHLALVGLSPYVLTSKSGAGFHLYVFFRDPVPAWKARQVMLHICRKAGVIGIDNTSYDRLFPSQDKLSSPESPGNLIAMPFQGAAMEKGWTLIMDPKSDYTRPHTDQIAILEGINKVTEAALDSILATQGVQSPPPVKHVTSAPKGGEPHVKEYPPADLALIEQHCAFMAHCRDTAKSLGEPKWFAQACIFAHCVNGEALFQERSQSHPGFTVVECASKFEHALAYGPRTCESIEAEFNFDGCSTCIYRDQLRSPIALGNPSPVVQARCVLARVLKDVPQDPGAPFKDDALAAFAQLSRSDYGHFIRLRNALKTVGVPVKQLDDAISAHRREKNSAGVPYRTEAGRMFYERPAVGGISDVLLANFAVTITEEITRDDGAEQAKAFRLDGQLASGKPLPSIVVDASTFSSCNWVTEKYGASAVVMPGQRDHYLAAVKLLSQNLVPRTIYSHTGWREFEDGYGYLDSEGAIKQNGRDSSAHVDLPTAMQSYSLPMVDGVAPSYREAIEASLRLLALAPPAVSYTLLAAIYRAPLAEASPVDFSIFIEGLTGTRKSECAAIAQGHFGPGFHGKNLPGSWASTENALEKAAFLAKDAILVIDDFNPVGTIADVSMWHRKADRVLRGQGNQAGRARMQANGAFRPTYFPRGLILATGESLPRGASLRARMLILEFDQQTVNLEVLTELQGKVENKSLAQAMAGYVQWLAPQMKDLKARLGSRKDKEYEEISGEAKVHSRTPEIVTSLMQGMEMFLAFARQQNVMSEEEAATMHRAAREAILEAARGQASHQASESPCRRFLELLASALVSGVCHLEKRSGGVPDSIPDSCGWRPTPVPGGGEEMRPQGTRIGWLDPQGVYLIPDAAFGVAQRLASTQGYTIPLGIRDIKRHLRDDKFLVSTDGKNNTIRIGVGNLRQRVLHLAVASLFDVTRAPVTFPPLSPVPFPVCDQMATLIEDAPLDMDEFE